MIGLTQMRVFARIGQDFDDVTDHLKARPALVVGLDDRPRRFCAVCERQGSFISCRIIVPFLDGLEIEIG